MPARIDFQTEPARYRHWKLKLDGAVAELILDVDENATLFEGYQLKLNSYDLGVDIELADAVQRLRFERGHLVFDADYVRGRMMKTTVTVEPQGKLVIETRNRHEMALRWLDALRGRKHLRLIIDRTDRESPAPE